MPVRARAFLLAAVLAVPSALLLGLVFGDVRAQAPGDTAGAAVPAAEAGSAVAGSGVVVRFTSPGSGATDVRVDRMISLLVAEGAAPSALVGPGAFRAEWEA